MIGNEGYVSVHPQVLELGQVIPEHGRDYTRDGIVLVHSRVIGYDDSFNHGGTQYLQLLKQPQGVPG